MHASYKFKFKVTVSIAPEVGDLGIPRCANLLHPYAGRVFERFDLMSDRLLHDLRQATCPVPWRREK